ncbi:hypothetical protein V6Z11_D10G012900 [Gossypium hirsutum]
MCLPQVCLLWLYGSWVVAGTPLLNGGIPGYSLEKQSPRRLLCMTGKHSYERP